MFGLSQIFSKVCGREKGGVTADELQDILYHNKFSDYLPWLAYDPDKKLYYNTDNTVGFVWECTPLVFSAEKTLQITEALLRLPLPPMSVMQFLLHADSNIKPVLDAYRELRPTDDPLILDAVDNYCRFLEESTQGLPQTSGIPLRNIRLIVSLKFAADSGVKVSEILSQAQETLSGMHLAPRSMTPPLLLEWLRRLLNDAVPEVKGLKGDELASLYNDTVPIGKQVLLGDTPIDVEFDHLRIGERFWRCMTPKVYPAEVDPLQTKELFGGIWGLRSDNEQHRVPFLYSLNIIFDNLKHHLRTKCDLMLSQSAAGSFARSLRRKQEEHTWAIDKIDQGQVFARVMPAMWFIGDSYAEADDALKRGKTMWEGAGYVMQEDKGILAAMLLSSLPMGLRASKHNLNMLERDTIAATDSICNILPVQGDFSGSHEPVIILQGRSGQICPVSIFSKMANNYNGFIAGTSGGGKSFFLNMLAFCLLTTGTLLRIIDIGGSYKRLAHIFGGKYLDFGRESDICLNPFSNIVDMEEDLAAISAIVMQMVYSASDSPAIAEEEYTLAKDAVKWAYGVKGSAATVDDVYTYLRDYPAQLDANKRATEEIVSRAHRMAFNMNEFTSHGHYGRFFIGESNFDIARNGFVLLELEALKSKKDLFKVVTLLVLDAVTRDLYLSDRSQRRMVLFDEAWQFLSGAGGNVMMRDIIESGFRRARKYGGSFFICTQSLLDRQLFGQIGNIIWNNADYRFMLESSDYEAALAEKLISYDQFTVEVLKSVRKNSSKYSEIYMDTPYGSGVVRLSVDPFSYYLFTSDAREIAEMEAMVASGMTYREAMHEMVRKYRSS